MLENVCKLTTLIVLGCSFLYISAEARAGIVVDVDMDTSMAGIQRVRQASVGDVFPVDLIVTTDAAGVSSLSISVLHDNNELAFNSGSSEALPLGFMVNIVPGVTDAPNIGAGLGMSSAFDAATTGAGPFSKTFSIGTIDFRVAGLDNDNAPDVIPGFFSTVDLAFDNAMPANNLATSAVINTGRVSAIPEPTSFILMLVVGTGCCAIVGIKKLSRRKQD